MSDKLAGGIKAGSTSINLPVILRKTVDSTEQTAVAFGSVTASYRRQGAASVAVTMTSLASITAAFSSGGWFEADATNQPGTYRIDVPDAAFATGADWVIIAVKVAGCFMFYERFALESKGAAEVFAQIGTNGAGLTAVGDARLANLDAAVSTRLPTSSYGAAPTTVAIAGAILANPANKLATDASGNVGANNFPATVQLDMTQAHGSSPSFGTIGNAFKNANSNCDYPASAISTGVMSRPTAAQVAAAILANPANLLATDALGRITVGGYATSQDPGSYLITQGLTSARAANLDNLDTAVSTRLATSVYTLPPTSANIAAAILASPTNKLATDASGSVSLNLNQAVPLSNTSQTVGDSLNAARAQGFGQWVLDPAAKTLKLFGPDGVAVVRTFTLDSATATTVRA